jgi:ADP-ribose pyrophosphatase
MIVTRTRKIFEGKVVRLVIREVRLPNGNLALREVVEHAEAVAIVALDDAQQVILVRQYRIGADQDLYEIPAGLVEAGETPEENAVRELREEIGYEPGDLQSLGAFYPTPGSSTELIRVYLGRDLKTAPLAQDEDEFIETLRLPFADALRMIETGEIVDGKSIIGLLRAARLLSLG